MRNAKRFEKIYKEYHRLVRGILFNMAGGIHLDDLTQEAFTRIWKGLPLFTFRSTIKTWVCRITINTAIDHLRKRSMQNVEFIDDDHANTHEPNEQDIQKQIQESLMQLDENHRSLVILYYFEELDHKQISEILEIPLGTVKSRLHSAKQKLKSVLETKGVYK